MSKLQFSSEDFWKESDDIEKYYITPGFATMIANAKLAEIKKAWLAELKANATVVYGYLAGNAEIMYGPNQHEESTHRAYLIGIEEIKPKECEHEPLEAKVTTGPYTLSVTFDYSTNSKCKHCGVKLKAKWEPVE